MQRSHLNNNSATSLNASVNQNKSLSYKKEHKSRSESYKAKFSKPHMIIPQEDFLWAIEQPNSVKTLFMQCWMSDPYGSRPIQLNHSLKPSSFKAAKKAISDAGLFIFKSERSVRDARESVCWMVVNLHGARRNDYWLNQDDQEASHLTAEVKDLTAEVKDLTPKASHLTSISIETQSQQGFQNASETPQEHLINSSKEFMRVLPEKNEASDRDRDPALGEQVTSAPLSEEKKEADANESALATSNDKHLTQECETTRQGQEGLSKKSTAQNEVLEQEYKFDWRSTAAVDRASAQILAIEEQKTTEEYQSAFEDAAAQIRAKFAQLKKEKQIDRELRLRGDSPSWS